MNHDIMQTLIDAGVSEARCKTIAPVVQNCEWMRERLDIMRAELEDEPLIVEYTNGNGITSDRENMLFAAYEKMWKAYMLGMAKVLDALPKETQIAAEDDELKPTNVLEFMRSKRRKEA